jgi:hypothetical protein
MIAGSKLQRVNVHAPHFPLHRYYTQIEETAGPGELDDDNGVAVSCLPCANFELLVFD